MVYPGISYAANLEEARRIHQIPRSHAKEQRPTKILQHHSTHVRSHSLQYRAPLYPKFTTCSTRDKATSYFEVADPVLGSLSTGTPLIPFSPGWLVPDRTPTPVAPESEATGALPGLEATVSPEVWPGALGAPVPSSGGGLVGSIRAGEQRVLVVDAGVGGQSKRVKLGSSSRLSSLEIEVEVGTYFPPAAFGISRWPLGRLCVWMLACSVEGLASVYIAGLTVFWKPCCVI